jgi:hypothetical protein
VSSHFVHLFIPVDNHLAPGDRHDIAEPRIQEHYEDVSTLTSGGQAVSVIQGLPYNSEDDDGPYGPFE